MDEGQGKRDGQQGNRSTPPPPPPPAPADGTAAGTTAGPGSSDPADRPVGIAAPAAAGAGGRSSQPAWVLPTIVALTSVIVICLLVLGWWFLSGRAQTASVDVGQQGTQPNGGSAQSGQESGTQSPPTRSATSAPPAPAPTLADLANATIRVPPQCAAFAHHSPGGSADTVTFSGGVATSTEDAATITLEDRVTTTVSGTPVAVVSMRCFGGGNYSSDSIGVYDGSLDLVAGAEPAADGEVGGYVPDLQVQDLEAQEQDSTVSFTVPAIGVFGDGSCHACTKSASAALTYRLSTGALTLSDIVYRTPSGSVRPPDVATLQTFVEAVSTGDDRKAATWAAADQMKGLDDHLGGPGNTQTQRDAQFPTDSRVVGCALVGPLDDSISNTETVAGKPVPVFEVDGMRAGDFVCPVVSEHSVQEVMAPTRDEYSVYLVVHSDDQGNPFVYFFGRDFG